MSAARNRDSRSAAWPEFPLTDVFEVRSGLSKPASAFGSGFPFVTFKDVLDNIFLPDVRTQEAIGYTLRSLDDKIDLNRRMNATLEALAAAIFKAWFVDFEPVRAKAAGSRSFPGMPQDVFDALPDSFEDSGAGPVPKGWRVAPVSELADYVNGRAFTKHANGRGRMIIRIAELNSGPGGNTPYSDVEANPENTAYPGDLLFSWSGSLGIYRWYRDEAIINQHIFKVIPKDWPLWLVKHALDEALPFFRMIAAAKATTMGHIQRNHLSQAQVCVGTASILAAAGRLIEPLFELALANERESLVLAATRDLLLPRLLSGELCVNTAPEPMEVG